MYFKKNYQVLVLLLMAGLLQFGCEKYETEPVEVRKEGDVYDPKDINGNLAEQALTNLYVFLPKGFNRIGNSFLDAATDDGVTSQVSSDIDLLSRGLQSPTLTVDDSFADNYTGIYRVNEFLSKIDVVPVVATTKQYWKAEARFLRALFYFELVKRYGGVPLLGDKVSGLSDNLQLPRNTYAECVQYIVSECDAISGLLRKEPVSTVETGRITQGAALALKARTLLYAASPLNNPANDLTKWQAAYNASKAIVDLNVYALNASFVTAFTNRSSTEVILGVQQAKNQALEKANAPVGFTELNASSGLTSPSQELVDAFPTINGKPIATDLKSGSNPTGYDAANPYVNRDPRFNATIFFNGSKWLGRNVETFEGGKDKPGGTLIQTKTGYYLRKFLPDLSTAANYSAVDHNFILFRYAETLLNYAEAANEMGDLAANRQIAYTQLTALRKRAGLTAGTGSLYGLKANMTQGEMRDAIKLERRIELAFEEHRFWDVRRWKTAATDFNKTLHGVKIVQASPGVFTYQPVNVAPLVFVSPKMYLYPIPYNELQSNAALVQNPGWQ